MMKKHILRFLELRPGGKGRGGGAYFFSFTDRSRIYFDIWQNPAPKCLYMCGGGVFFGNCFKKNFFHGPRRGVGIFWFRSMFFCPEVFFLLLLSPYQMRMFEIRISSLS